MDDPSRQVKPDLQPLKKCASFTIKDFLKFFWHKAQFKRPFGKIVLSSMLVSFIFQQMLQDV